MAIPYATHPHPHQVPADFLTLLLAPLPIPSLPSCPHLPPPPLRDFAPVESFRNSWPAAFPCEERSIIANKFGESLEGSQATPSFWEVPGLPRKFPELPRKFFGDFPGSSLTVELNSNPGVPRKFPGSSPNFPGSSRTSPEVSPFLWEA